MSEIIHITNYVRTLHWPLKSRKKGKHNIRSVSLLKWSHLQSQWSHLVDGASFLPKTYIVTHGVVRQLLNVLISILLKTNTMLALPTPSVIQWLYSLILPKWTEKKSFENKNKKKKKYSEWGQLIELSQQLITTSLS